MTRIGALLVTMLLAACGPANRNYDPDGGLAFWQDASAQGRLFDRCGVNLASCGAGMGCFEAHSDPAYPDFWHRCATICVNEHGVIDPVGSTACNAAGGACVPLAGSNTFPTFCTRADESQGPP